MNDFDNQFIKEIENIVKEAGKIILSYFKKSFKISIKKGQYVTDADIKSEDFLKNKLSKLFPEASIIAEESGDPKISAEYSWVIDPLDGTTNFVHGIPYFCISVALTYKDKPIIGFIYDPLRKELFRVKEGEYSFLNNKKIEVSKENNLKNCFFAVSFPCSFKSDYEELWIPIRKVRRECYALRLFGAAALDLAYVACGRFNGAFFKKLKWWDVAAGTLLIEQSGGIVTNYKGENISKRSFDSFVAAPDKVHKQLMNIINKKLS